MRDRWRPACSANKAGPAAVEADRAHDKSSPGGPPCHIYYRARAGRGQGPAFCLRQQGV